MDSDSTPNPRDSDDDEETPVPSPVTVATNRTASLTATHMSNDSDSTINNADDYKQDQKVSTFTSPYQNTKERPDYQHTLKKCQAASLKTHLFQPWHLRMVLFRNTGLCKWFIEKHTLLANRIFTSCQGISCSLNTLYPQGYVIPLDAYDMLKDVVPGTAVLKIGQINNVTPNFLLALVYGWSDLSKTALVYCGVCFWGNAYGQQSKRTRVLHFICHKSVSYGQQLQDSQGHKMHLVLHGIHGRGCLLWYNPWLLL